MGVIKDVIETPKGKVPAGITLHTQSKILEVVFDKIIFNFPFEFLRVYSPSAEVRGHGVGQEVLQIGQRDVRITALAPVGNYAVLPNFSDGHHTGIFSWDYLYWLGVNQTALWQDYERRLHAAGFDGETGRDPR